jgi:hypothetical protein
MNKEQAFEIAKTISTNSPITDVRVLSVKGNLNLHKDDGEEWNYMIDMVGYSKDGNHWVEFRTDGQYCNGRYGKSDSERTIRFPNSFNTLTELISFFNQKFK